MNNGTLPPPPKLKPDITYGNVLQTIVLMMSLIGIVWLASSFQTETRLKLEALAISVDDLKNQINELKVELADIKGRLPPRK